MVFDWKSFGANARNSCGSMPSIRHASTDRGDVNGYNPSNVSKECVICYLIQRYTWVSFEQVQIFRKSMCKLDGTKVHWRARSTLVLIADGGCNNNSKQLLLLQVLL